MVSPGDRMPFCAGLGANDQFFSFDALAGRAAVLLIAPNVAEAAADPIIAALAAIQPDLATRQAELLRLADFTAAPPTHPGIAVIRCQDDFFARCGAPPNAPLVVVIDRATRVVAAWAGAHNTPTALAAAALDAVTSIAREPARDCTLPAPVLPIPGVFDAAFCEELIERFETGANFDSGVSGAGADGKPANRLSHDKKRRRDWLLARGDPFYDRVLRQLFRRCGPAIKRAFQCEMSHADRILVARYDETGGYFRRHRDNTAASVAFRQFALSVNLNTGYDGGHLLFPEFNDHRYRPAAGEGIVFSASLLHEVAPITRHRRYVLLTFLHDSEAEARRTAAHQPRKLELTP